MNRRDFVLGSASLAALFGTRAFAVPAGTVSTAGANLRFGVLSDIHLFKPGDEDTFLAALRYFRDHGADGVVIAGDIADRGRIDQLERCAAAWYSVFPDNKSPDGRPVEKLFVYGNHDMLGWNWTAKDQIGKPEVREQFIGLDGKESQVWEKVFGEKYEPIWMKSVKGYTFIGGHWMTNSDPKIWEFLEKHGKELDPKKPFFYIQHAHPKDTCMGAWAWGHDSGASTKALSRFPNAVAFSGHSHYSLTDERTVWQGAFTSINTCSLRYCSNDYSLRENFTCNGSGYRGEKRKHAMRQMETGDARHGMLVSVLGDRLVIERRDFVSGRSVGDDWIVPVPAKPENAMSFAERAARRSAPEFAADAKATVETKDGLLTVSFPPAKSVAKCRVYEYEVTATLVEDDVDLVQAQRRAMAPDFHKPETEKGASGSCVFKLDELPLKGHYVFSVRPIECFGKKGRAISVATVV